MRKIYTMAVVVLLATAPIMLLAQADGAALYGEKCAMCHGAKGEGNKDMGMPPTKGTEMTAEGLVTFLLKGEQGKAVHAGPVGQLNEEQAKAVSGFVKNLK